MPQGIMIAVTNNGGKEKFIKHKHAFRNEVFTHFAKTSSSILKVRGPCHALSMQNHDWITHYTNPFKDLNTTTEILLK